MPASFVAQFCAENIYWNKILLKPLPKLLDVNIRDILRIWEMLSSWGLLLNEKLPDNTEVTKVDQLLLFSPNVKRHELIRSVKDHIDLSIKQINVVIDLFVFNGESIEDLWLKPFIYISDNVLCVNIASLNFPNLVCSIEYWMKIGGLDLSDRGYAFEEYVKYELIEYISSSTYLKDSIVPKDLKKIKIGVQSEQIDLLWIIGNTIIVGEVKCSIFPTEALGKHNYYNTLKQAVLQVKRKTDFLRDNIAILQSYLKLSNHDISKLRFEPIVVVNLPLSVGFPIDGVPIVDLLILSTFLKGKQEFISTMSIDGEKKSLIQEVFYSSIEEAERNIHGFFMEPSIIKYLKKLLVDDRSQLFPINNSLKPCFQLRLRVDESILSDFAKEHEMDFKTF